MPAKFTPLPTETEPEPYRLPGRPPKSPKNVIRRPIRCLVTRAVSDTLEKAAAVNKISLSDIFRLAIFRYLEESGDMTPELRRDATWDTLRGAGRI